MKIISKAAVIGLSLWPLGALALENGNFDDLDARAEGNVTYGTQGGVGFIPSWTILADEGGMIRTQSGFGAEGDSAFTFNELDDGFGSNKIEQCLPIDPSQSLTLRYSIKTSVSSDDVRTRLNPNFYPDMAACEVNLQVDDNSNRLSFSDSNEDFDQQLGGSSVREDEWYTIDPVVFEADSLLEEAKVLRISLRVRDRSGDDAVVYLDDVRATQGQSSTNLIRNGRFDHIERDDGDYLSGDDGWYLDREQGLRASVGPFSFAQSGENLFYFESLTANFGASRLDQCVPLNGEDNIRPSLRAMSLTPDDELSLRVDVSFYADEACTDDASDGLSFREDFDIDGEAGQWLTLITEEFREAAAVVDASSARLSIRARDRSVGEDEQNPPFARTLYIDDVTLVSTVPAPTFDPGAQEFTTDELVVTINGPEGSTLYVSTDGSEPSESSMAMMPGETITVTETTTLSVIAVIDGESSSVRSATYTRVEEEEETPVDEAPEEEDTGPSGNNRSGASTGLLFALATLMLALRPRTIRGRTLKQ